MVYLVDIYGKRTLSETNSLPLKIDACKTTLFFGGRTVSFRDPMGNLARFYPRHLLKICQSNPRDWATSLECCDRGTMDSGPWTSSTLCQVRALQTSLESWNWQLRKEGRKIWQVAIPKKGTEYTGIHLFLTGDDLFWCFFLGKIREAKSRFPYRLSFRSVRSS